MGGSSPCWVDKCRILGFSAYEMLISLAITSGLIATGSVFFRIVQDTAQTSEINLFISQLNLARSEAVKQGHDVVVCPSRDGQHCDAADDYTWWHRGVLLFVDTSGNRDPANKPVIHRHVTETPKLRIKSSPGRPHIVYRPNGFSTGTNLTLTFCDPRGTANARYVIVSNVGRVRASSKPVDSRIDEKLEMCP